MTPETLRARAHSTIEKWEQRSWERRSQDEADDALIDALAAEFTTLVAEARREQVEKDAKIAESWKGRRLSGDYPDTSENQAWGRGVDMASHYIAAALRAQEPV